MSETQPQSGMVSCTVEVNSWGNMTITFPDYPNKSLFFQFDFDQIAFAYAAGAPIGAGDPTSKEFDAQTWIDFDPEIITQCPDDYVID